MIRFARAIGANTDLLTAQAFIFSREEGSLGLSLLISAAGEDIFSKVRQVATQVEELFFDSEQKMADRLEQVMKFLREELTLTDNLEILLSVCQDNLLYLLSVGHHQALLLRNGQTVTLKTPENQLVSGFLKPGDRLLLLTGKIEGESPGWDEQLVKQLLASELEVFEEDLESYLQTIDRLNPVAAILMEQPVASEETAAPSVDQPIPALEQLDQAGSIKGAELIQTWAGRLTQLLPQQRRGRLYLAGVIVAIILAGIAWSIYQQNQAEKRARYLSLYNLASEKYQLAKNFKDIDSSQAQKNLAEAQQALDQALAINSQASELKNLADQIKDDSSSILRIYQINDWPIFLSLDLIRPGFTANQLSFSLGKILLLDTNQKSLVAVDLKKKTPQILAGERQLGQAFRASLNGQTAFVHSLDKGIIRVDLPTNKASTVAAVDEDWGKISDLFGFGGNVYLLDSLKNQIWKYTPVASGYAGRFAYIKDGQSVDLASSIRLQIDYSVWVLKGGPEIIKLTGGLLDHFAVGGLDQPVKEIKSFFVTEEKDTVYLLDSTSSRLVVLKKNGQYQAQYRGDKFKTATDFVIDEQNKKIYLLENNKIYQIELK